jgi:hypothetical protein
VKNLNVPLSWTQVEGDPVALLALVPGRDGDDGARSLDQVEVREGEIYVAGRTTPAGQMSAPPRGDLSQSLVNLAMLPETNDKPKKSEKPAGETSTAKEPSTAKPERLPATLAPPPEMIVPAAEPTGKATTKEALLDVKPPPAEFPVPQESRPPAPPTGGDQAKNVQP